MNRSRDPRLPGFDRAASSSATKVENVRGSRAAGLKWRCYTCGEIHRYWSRAEQHSDALGHRRIEVVF